MNRGGNSGLRFTCMHKLQQSHLCGRILHSHTVGGKIDVVFSSLETLRSFALPQVGIQNFFGQCKWFIYCFAGCINPRGHGVVHPANHLNVEYHC